MRKIRYRQVLRHRCANHGRGTYAQQVQLQKLFWREDNTPTPTIKIVREIHSSLGTWDSKVQWRSIDYMTNKKGSRNRILVGGLAIYPKGNYKFKTKIRQYVAKKARWKEQENRTLEFFEREGC